MRFVLASASERRKVLLMQIGLNFEVEPSNADENIDDNIPPEQFVKMLASKKADAVAQFINEDAVIVAADTIVCFEGLIVGKPTDADDAFNILTMLSGKKHSVYTGMSVVVMKDGQRKIVESVDRADVYFRELSETEIRNYIATGEPFDKAGAYGIQNKGAIFAEKVEGDIYTVVGLPIVKLYTALRDNNIDITEFWE